MRKELKPLEIQKYFENWKLEFSDVLKTVIANQLGYHRKDRVSFGRIPASIKTVKSQKKDLEKFQKSFDSLCKRFGVAPAESVAVTATMPQNLINQFRKLYSSLSSEIDSLKNQSNVRKPRKRIPHSVAFELARAFHFCSGDVKAREVFRKIIEDQNKLNFEVEKTIHSVKIGLTIWLMDQTKTNRILMKNAATKARREQLNVESRKLAYERKRLKLQQISISLIGVRRNSDHMWAGHLKDHLLKSLLSEGRDKLIKKLSDKDKRLKRALLRQMELKNIETLKY